MHAPEVVEVTYLELGVVVGTVDEMDDPRQPSLLLDRLVRLHPSPLRLHTRIARRLLHPLLDQNPQDLHQTLDILWCLDLGLISEDVPRHFSRHGSSGGIGLCSEERQEAGEGESSEQRRVGLDGCEE